MSEVTRLMVAIENGDRQASEVLLPIVYEELRRLARTKMGNERGEHTLQATALVHEAYLRLIGSTDGQSQHWGGRGHFFAAAAEAMRRILIEHARGKNAMKRGGEFERIELDRDCAAMAPQPREADDLLALDEALNRLAAESPGKAELVKLRYFAGLTIEEAAAAMKISPATAKRHWAYARAYLFRELAARNPT
jgi:RNA polymerase sigma factor (TIGR02999 family)